MPSVVVVGLQWGDEGKGKVIDLLAEFADVVVRFQGGANAGHTVRFGDTKIITNLIPSGASRPGKKVIIGPSVVLDPDRLLGEIQALQAGGFLVEPERLLISDRCHLVLPYHKLLDEAREKSRGRAKIGTTLRGIGPCLEDKASRLGIRAADLLQTTELEDKLAMRVREVNALLRMYGFAEVDIKQLLADTMDKAERLKSYLADVGEIVRLEMERGKNILFEGAQGAMLDIDHGTYPFVTSSSTIAASACTSLGISPQKIDLVVGVLKAYTTRVGEGPFPTELHDERGEILRQAGGEFGATTGRPRRCGWLDLVALKYAVALNGAGYLCITKLDVLSCFDELQIGVAYQLDGNPLPGIPARSAVLARVEPVLEKAEGWKNYPGRICDIREQQDLPRETKKYLDKISGALSVPVGLISVGPTRAETIMVKNPFRR